MDRAPNPTRTTRPPDVDRPLTATRLFGLLGAPVLGLGAGAAVVAFLTPLPRDVPSRPAEGEWVGAVHVHTVASDGGGTVRDVARAARRQGLDFVVLTDHNTRGTDSSRYLAGPGDGRAPLLVLGEEVSTDDGHLLVLGEAPVGNRRGPVGRRVATRWSTPSVAPAEGFRIAAHPTSRPRWTAWQAGHFDAVEIWNADTERRHRDDALEWARAAAILPFRPQRAFYQLLDYPEPALALWDDLQPTGRSAGPVPGLCSVDAHHRLPLGPVSVPLPSYRQSFGLASQHVLLERPASDRAGVDARAVIEALGAGRSWCGFDGLADARGLEISVRSAHAEGTLGATLEWTEDAELRVLLPPSGIRARIRLIRDGREVARTRGRRWTVPLDAPGSYRVEAFLRAGDRWLPWILTNPVRLRGGG